MRKLVTALVFTVMLPFMVIAQTPEISAVSGSDGEEVNNEIIPISQARQMPVGSRVTVTGWVTVTDEFRGPVYFQDETAGLAWFNGPLMRQGDFDIDVARGDSLVITGDLGVFGALPGQPETGLLQIVGNDVEFEIYPEGNRDVAPLVVTINQLNTGSYEGQLVTVNDATINNSGILEGGTNYTMVDATGDGVLRIDSRSSIPGTTTPMPPVDLTGVAGMFQNSAQLLPRTPEDLGDNTGFPGEDIPKSETFDIVTWNIEWFGDANQGPGDVDQQFENVLTVIENIDADLYTFQEIASVARWNQLVNQLDGFSGILAEYSQTQKTAYLYRESVITPLASGLLTTGQNSFDWANRLPLWLHFSVTIGEETREIHSYGVHAKAFADSESYQRRVNASNQLKSYLDSNRSGDNVIFFGDYNDQLTVSTWSNQPSPYENFVEDPAYFPVTLSLEEAGATSFRSVSMIDHITVTNQLIEDHIDGAQRVENPFYITNFLNTTSDHYPVWTRFDPQVILSTDEPGREIPEGVTLMQNYPNPFNPVTNISFKLPDSEQVSLAVYDLTGRRVATLIDNQMRSSGMHVIAFDASRLASGVYIYSLELSGGQRFTNKMMLIK